MADGTGALHYAKGYRRRKAASTVHLIGPLCCACSHHSEREETLSLRVICVINYDEAAEFRTQLCVLMQKKKKQNRCVPLP